MQKLRAQGATQSSSLRLTTYCPLQGQGATEYLVLLAVVLIVALVSVALLGFFPGMASDAQVTQSKAYWQGASPVAIVDWVATYTAGSMVRPYLRLRNTGAYTIQITKVLGENRTATYYYDDANGSSVLTEIAASPVFRIASGGETYFGYHSGLPNRHSIFFNKLSSCYGYGEELCALAVDCSSIPGTMQINGFGFEYIEYIDNQPITKRQVGKPLLIKCST